MTKYLLFTCALLAMSYLSSCAKSERTVTSETVISGDQLKDQFASGFSYGKKGGELSSKSDKESDFAGKSFGGTSSYTDKEFNRSDFATKRWGGNTDYNSKKYAGNTSTGYLSKAPAFAQDQFNNKTSSYGDSAFSTSAFGGVTSASEGNKADVGTFTNTLADKDKTITPIIKNWKSQ
ncbi:hypothetical protein OAB00_03490, partial [Akkermansiaceae bacterium]|nr:hypothetical protein [Akkermansiaceae bacterium]